MAGAATPWVKTETLSPNRRLVEVDNEEIISELPEELINQILSLLPINNAVATSVLSSSWRYRWVNVPHLVFDDNSIRRKRRRIQEEEEEVDKLVKAISNVVVRHTGPINTFAFLYNYLPPLAAVDDWISHISTQHLSVLKIYFRLPEQQQQQGNPPVYYNIPSSLFNCRNLINLELGDCAINEFPSTFTGFNKLKTLRLQFVKSSDSVVDSIISSCPMLELLDLNRLEHVTRLNIYAPKLRSLGVDCHLEDVILGAHSLEKVLFCLRKLKEAPHAYNTNLCNFFNGMKNVTVVSFFLHTLRNFSIIDPVPHKLRKPCLTLKVLYLAFHKTSIEISACLCILRSCPRLTDLSIIFTPGDNHIPTCPNLPRLERLVVRCSRRERDIDFIKSLLLNTPNLKVLVAFIDEISSDDECPTLLEEIMQCERASARADIYVYQSSQRHSIVQWGGGGLRIINK